MTDKIELLPEWECFCDESYYHQWAVRPVNDKSWESQKLFHVPSKQEAEALRDLLNTRAPLPTGDKAQYIFPKEQPETALQAFDNMVAHYRDLLKNTNSIVEEEFSDFEDEIRASLTDLSDDVQELVQSANAVIERWESPLWKDLPATAQYISRLKNAVAKYSKKAGK